MDLHLLKCERAPRKCAFAPFGCAFGGTAIAVTNHRLTCSFAQLDGFFNGPLASLLREHARLIDRVDLLEAEVAGLRAGGAGGAERILTVQPRAARPLPPPKISPQDRVGILMGAPEEEGRAGKSERAGMKSLSAKLARRSPRSRQGSSTRIAGKNLFFTQAPSQPGSHHSGSGKLVSMGRKEWEEDEVVVVRARAQTLVQARRPEWNASTKLAPLAEYDEEEEDTADEGEQAADKAAEPDSEYEDEDAEYSTSSDSTSSDSESESESESDGEDGGFSARRTAKTQSMAFAQFDEYAEDIPADLAAIYKRRTVARKASVALGGPPSGLQPRLSMGLSMPSPDQPLQQGGTPAGPLEQEGEDGGSGKDADEMSEGVGSMGASRHDRQDSLSTGGVSFGQDQAGDAHSFGGASMNPNRFVDRRQSELSGRSHKSASSELQRQAALRRASAHDSTRPYGARDSLAPPQGSRVRGLSDMSENTRQFLKRRTPNLLPRTDEQMIRDRKSLSAMSAVSASRAGDSLEASMRAAVERGHRDVVRLMVYSVDPAVLALACSSLAVMATDRAKAAEMLNDDSVSAVEWVMQALVDHPEDSSVQRMSLLALEQLVQHSKGWSQFVELGGGDLLTQHGSALEERVHPTLMLLVVTLSADAVSNTNSIMTTASDSVDGASERDLPTTSTTDGAAVAPEVRASLATEATLALDKESS